MLYEQAQSYLPVLHGFENKFDIVCYLYFKLYFDSKTDYPLLSSTFSEKYNENLLSLLDAVTFL